VSSGGQSTPPADAAPAPAPAPADDDVRDVDFASVSQPGTACDEGLRITPPRRIAVDEGSSALLDLGSLTRLEVADEVEYADLDDDGDDEAVVHAVCNYGANGSQDTVEVWAVERGAPVVVDALPEPPTRVTGPLPPAVKDITVDEGELAVTWTHYTADDPNCCPSQQTVLHYRLDGDQLEQVGRPVTTPAAEPVTP
jgi:hypothetical protein